MAETSEFQTLIARVRTGDSDAAAMLVCRYESAIRRTIRARMVDSRLRALFDSSDICQSVLGSFFCRVALGQFELERPDDLVRLLVAMARNKLADQARRLASERRGGTRTRVGEVEQRRLSDPSPTADRVVAAREVLRMVRERLSPDEHRLVEERAAGRPWAELASEADTTAEALRKRHARALDRAMKELGLDAAEID